MMDQLKTDIRGFDYELLSQSDDYKIYGAKLTGSHIPIYIKTYDNSIEINKEEFNVKDYELIKEHVKKLAL